MILDPYVAIILIKLSVCVIIFELSFIIFNKIRVILSSLHTYYHFKKYDGTPVVLAELKLKESHELVAVYVDSSMSTNMLYA